ncbi:MAG TPA: hypothetical protein VHX90_06905 [Verrucomicrobiae bacterium]|nr:hypothetical protein [Verrucomicrobiae bacterium]
MRSTNYYGQIISKREIKQAAKCAAESLLGGKPSQTMNQDNNQITWLLKAILAMQILTLILFASAYFANSSVRAEYKKEMEQYRVKEAEYEKGMADYKVQLEAWQKANAAYTNTVSQPPTQ